MKQASSQRRSRSRNNNNGRRGHGNNRSSYESNGPDVKVRGSAQQVLDKYLQLARDAQSSGDRVAAESYLQFAEHYYRIANANNATGTTNTANNVADATSGGEANADGESETESVATHVESAPAEGNAKRAPRRGRRPNGKASDVKKKPEDSEKAKASADGDVAADSASDKDAGAAA